MGGTEYFRETAPPRDHTTCQHHAEITQSHRSFAALTRLSTTTHNPLTFNTSQRSSNNSGKTQPIGRYTPLDFSLTLVLFKFQDLESHGRQSSVDPGCTPEKKLSLTWSGAKFTGNFALA